MMSAHLSQPIISTASAVPAAETATWAETVCAIACAGVRVCVVEMEIRCRGCIRTGLQCAKSPMGTSTYTRRESQMHERDITQARRLRVTLQQPPPKMLPQSF